MPNGRYESLHRFGTLQSVAPQPNSMLPFSLALTTLSQVSTIESEYGLSNSPTKAILINKGQRLCLNYSNLMAYLYESRQNP